MVKVENEQSTIRTTGSFSKSTPSVQLVKTVLSGILYIPH